MPVPHYGVWACRPFDYYAEGRGQRTPHIYLYFRDDSSGKRTAAINVKSNGKESRLVYWVDKDFTHPVTDKLDSLELGFHLIQDPPNNNNNGNQHRHHTHRHFRYSHFTPSDPDLEGLDFYRTKGLVNILAGEVLKYDIAGPDNDILDKLEPILQAAIADGDATAYIFGASFGSGIHNIHMNQGSLPKYDNGIYSDGGLLFRFSDGHWEAVFLAFASQRLPTGDDGEAERGSETLLQIIQEAVGS
ncbi:hypothetical protein CBS76997_8076 [Aspergillus niger]|uniref:Uncharacterized protein n=2 Tax=Aspergillus TaxID=5052 RepID=A0A370PGB1_ASPPH|nr:hypothetical protein CBS13152_3538 [Aspergillus niger]RDK41218.1 hypothetical protein M752DRAFT_303048 [Aspergillus phoenicis ATCC 13157]KAI2959347.1 hypothetical protein CBS147323_8386 [Aspergillus niger]KAI3003091.1 hypothetical protein CBS147346_5556 [Aspergillus niger]KAI3039107.1 hypothetical protein CBS76997_8076 [Aspergillus niger]